MRTGVNGIGVIGQNNIIACELNLASVCWRLPICLASCQFDLSRELNSGGVNQFVGSREIRWRFLRIFRWPQTGKTRLWPL